MTSPQTLLLTRSDVASVLDYDSCITAVHDAFAAAAAEKVLPAVSCGTPVSGGGFHVKTAGLQGDRLYFAAKVNGNFPGNMDRTGFPTIQGVITLHDAVDGRVLAVMDSIHITGMRTAAASAVAARYLAREDARVATIIGCGVQGRSQLRALLRVRKIEQVYAHDHNQSSAQLYSEEMSRELGIPVEVASDYRAAARGSDIVVTCTSSRAPILDAHDVSSGCFIAAVGADSEYKHEIDPSLLTSSTVVADVLDQCVAYGDVHHAIAAGVMTRDDVHAELADVVGGTKRGRSGAQEVIVFDSTGTALEDVAAAAVIYERASAANIGTAIDFGA